MSEDCCKLHEMFNGLNKYFFPLDENSIPLNGIYVLFEKGEFAHKTNRIVRIGTHTGNNQLRSRLKQHFVNENKDRSYEVSNFVSGRGHYIFLGENFNGISHRLQKAKGTHSIGA